MVNIECTYEANSLYECQDNCNFIASPTVSVLVDFPQEIDFPCETFLN